MALLNKAGTFLYHVALFLTFGILFLTLKNYNLEEPGDTMAYGKNLKLVLFVLIGILISFGAGLTLAASISRARKKGFLFGVMLFFMWAVMAATALFTFATSIMMDELQEPGWRYGVITVGTVLVFVSALGLILLQFPGNVEKDILANKIKKQLLEEKKKSKPYCPVCKARVEKDHKYCPKCGARFSD